MKKLVILTGGMSPEKDVSAASYENFKQHIDYSKYQLIGVKIVDNEQWILQETGELVNIASENGQTILITKNEKISVDLVLPLFHGDGECGALQGMLEAMNIKYIGTKMLGSVLCFDKISSKRIVQNFGLKTTPFFEYNIYQENFSQACAKLNTHTLMIKPSRSGSTFGVNIVENQEKFEKAIEFAKKFDTEIVIEKYIKNAREVFCGYLNGFVSKIGEIVVQNHAIFDYETKYTNNGLSKFVQANVSNEVAEKIRSDAMLIFKLLKCENFARADFFIDENNEVYFSEVNTIPGLTNKSLFIDLMRISGVDIKEIVSTILTGV